MPFQPVEPLGVTFSLGQPRIKSNNFGATIIGNLVPVGQPRREGVVHFTHCDDAAICLFKFGGASLPFCIGPRKQFAQGLNTSCGLVS